MSILVCGSWCGHFWRPGYYMKVELPKVRISDDSPQACQAPQGWCIPPVQPYPPSVRLGYTLCVFVNMCFSPGLSHFGTVMRVEARRDLREWHVMPAVPSYLPLNCRDAPTHPPPTTGGAHTSISQSTRLPPLALGRTWLERLGPMAERLGNTYRVCAQRCIFDCKSK